MELNLELNEEKIDIDFEDSEMLNTDFGEVTKIQTGETTDYEELNNLPSLDGRKIIGNINELDPTVPNWAKQENKPEYNADEVGAVDENNALSLAEIDKIWKQVFSD